MSASTRLVLTSDTHVGLDLNREKTPSARTQWHYVAGLANVVSVAIRENADAILHAGDIVHDEHAASWVCQRVRTAVKRANDAGIELYYVPGNHDVEPDRSSSYARDGRFTDGLPTISAPTTPVLDDIASGLQMFPLGTSPQLLGVDTAVYGIPLSSVWSDEWFAAMDGVYELDEPAGRRFRIGCVHAGFREAYDKCTYRLGQFLDQFDDTARPDLVVCGHLHQPKAGSESGVGWLYPGMPTDGKGTDADDAPSVTLLDVPTEMDSAEWWSVEVPTSQSGTAALAREAAAALERRRPVREPVPAELTTPSMG